MELLLLILLSQFRKAACSSRLPAIVTTESRLIGSSMRRPTENSSDWRFFYLFSFGCSCRCDSRLPFIHVTNFPPPSNIKLYCNISRPFHINNALKMKRRDGNSSCCIMTKKKKFEQMQSDAEKRGHSKVLLLVFTLHWREPRLIITFTSPQ